MTQDEDIKISPPMPMAPYTTKKDMSVCKGIVNSALTRSFMFFSNGNSKKRYVNYCMDKNKMRTSSCHSFMEMVTGS